MILEFPAKALRAVAIKEYVGDKPVVCFTCGNAAKALREQGMNVLEIGEHGIFTPTKWFTQKEIADIFPNHFDATPGHLPMELMLKVANEFKNFLPERLFNQSCYDILSGSGETLVCLKLAFPELSFRAIYNVEGFEKETEYNEQAPLNKMVELLASEVIK